MADRVYTVTEIADKINARARELAPELLPNGHYSQGKDKWMFSGIPDHGKSASAWVHLSGPKIGKWFDMGNAAPGEDKGDMLDLLRLKLGLADARAAIEEAKARLGIADDWKPGKPAELSPEEKARRAAEAQARAEERDREQAARRAKGAKRAVALYLGGAPIHLTPAAAYLYERGLEPGKKWPGVLRYRGDCWYQDDDGRKMEVPAMLAPIYLANGQQIGTHRTYLQRREDGCWGKLAVANPKKVLGNMWGGFIPISKGFSGKSMRHMPDGEPVYLTEGIEDALVVRMIRPGVRIITAISVPNFGAVVLPPAARELVIVCDRDSNATAQEQLERAIGQQQARGLNVRLVLPPAEVNGHPVKDMNDWLLALRAPQGGVVKAAGGAG